MPSFVPPPVPDLTAAQVERPSSHPPAPPAQRTELPDFAKAPALEKTDVDIRLARSEPVEPTPPFVDISFEDPEAQDEDSVTVPHARVQFDRIAQKSPDESAPRPAFPRRAPTPLPEHAPAAGRRASVAPAPAAFVPREDRDPYMSRMPTEVVTRPSGRGAFVWLGVAVLVAIAIGAAIAVLWSGVLDGPTATIEPEAAEPRRAPEPPPPAVMPSMEVARTAEAEPPRPEPPAVPEEPAPGTSAEPEQTQDAEPPSAPEPEVELPQAPASYARLSARTRSLRAERFRTQARREHAHSRYQRAHDAWIEALRFVPNDPVSAQGVARSLARLDRMDDAIAWARRGVDLSPNDPRARELLGELYEDAGRLEDAREQYRAGLASAGRDARLSHRVRRVEGALRRRR